MKATDTLSHPTDSWRQEAQQPHLSRQVQLRLAAMAGHMQVDRFAARRAALIDLLADGHPYPRATIWEAIAARLGPDCWGKRPREGLARDLAALRQGGIRIAYSRRPGAQGYYLQHPPLEQPPRRQLETLNWTLIARLRQLTVPQKNEQAFAAADFALTQKRLILAEEHPDWTGDDVDREARRQVYGSSEVA